MITVIVIAAIAFGVYYLSLRRHPYRRCPYCRGTGTHGGQVFRSSYGNYRNQKIVRAGVRIFAPKIYQDIRDGRGTRNY